MTKKEAIKLFEERKVRTVWDDELEKWYFSIVDVIGVLTDSPDPRNFWTVFIHVSIGKSENSGLKKKEMKR